MNIREANQIIRLLNSIAEDVTRFGVIVEQAAWDGTEDHAGMPGQRPITAARLENPYGMRTFWRQNSSKTNPPKNHP